MRSFRESVAPRICRSEAKRHNGTRTRLQEASRRVTCSEDICPSLWISRATVYRSAVLPTGKQVVSHAKFVVVDHELLLITSANFSYSAENRNVEFGMLVRDTALAASVEATMTSKHGSLYELIKA